MLIIIIYTEKVESHFVNKTNKFLQDQAKIIETMKIKTLDSNKIL